MRLRAPCWSEAVCLRVVVCAVLVLVSVSAAVGVYRFVGRLEAKIVDAPTRVEVAPLAPPRPRPAPHP